MMELFIAGLALGLVLGLMIMRQKMESLEDLLSEAEDVISMQQRYIEQEDREMTIPEKARRIERHWHLETRFEVMTDKGMLVVKIFKRDDKAVRITYKNGEAVDIQKANPEPMRTKKNDVKFGGF